MNIIAVQNLQWADAAQTIIDLEVHFEEIGEFIPFTASSSDPEQHGKDLYTNSVNGDYGTIAAFSELVPSVDEIKLEARKRIEAAMPNWMVSREVSGGTPIDQNIKDYAASVRTTCTTLEGTLPSDYTDDSHWPVAP